MPYLYIAQFPIAQYLTPEHIAALVAGFGALTAGIGYAIRQAFEIRRINAQSVAEDMKSENEQNIALISILGEAVKTNSAIKDAWIEATTAIATQSKAIADGDERVADGLHAMASQTQALRQDLKLWPEAVTSSVSTLTETMTEHDQQVQAKLLNLETAVSELKERMSVTEANAVILNTFKTIIADWPDTKSKIAAIHAILNRYDGPPPEPDSATSRTQARVTNLDAAKNDATAGLPKTGTDG